MKHTILHIFDYYDEYRQLRMNNASFNLLYHRMREQPEQMTIPLFIDAYIELVKENDRLKEELTDCISRTPTQSIVVHDMPVKSSIRTRWLKRRWGM